MGTVPFSEDDARQVVVLWYHASGDCGAGTGQRRGCGGDSDRAVGRAGLAAAVVRRPGAEGCGSSLNPLWTLLTDQLRGSLLTRRYRKWLMQSAA